MNKEIQDEVERLKGFLDQAREVALVWKDAASTTWLNNGRAVALIDRALKLMTSPTAYYHRTLKAEMDTEAVDHLKEARTLLFKSPENGK